MKNSVMLIGCFAAGVLSTKMMASLQDATSGAATAVLFAILLLAGASMGATLRRPSWRKGSLRVLLLPLFTLVGSLLGVCALGVFLTRLGLRTLLLVGAGLGYYSLSAVMLAQAGLAQIAVLALLSHMMRELIAIACAPLFARSIGSLAPISAAGAASSDTVLPAIANSSGRTYIVLSVFHGMVLTFLVPFLLSGLLHV